MTDEVKVDIVDEKKLEPKQDEVKELTATEQQAADNGWQPKDQWEGDPDDWVPARQYIKNGELFGRINSYKNKIINLERTMGELVKHNERIYDVGFKDAMDSLKKEKKAALLEGNTERVLAIEDEVDELQADYNKKKVDLNVNVKGSNVESNPAWDAWIGNNSWYETDVELHGYADGVAKALVTSAQQVGKQVEFDKLLRETSRKVKEKFPEKFGNSGRPASSTNKGDDDTPVKRSSSSSKYSLNETEEEIFKTLSKGGMTREKYIDDLKKVKARKGER